MQDSSLALATQQQLGACNSSLALAPPVLAPLSALYRSSNQVSPSDPVVQWSAGMPKTVGVVYTRTSSDGKKVTGSVKRQSTAAGAAAKKEAADVKLKVSEIISGSLPYEQRKELRGLLERTHPKLSSQDGTTKVKVFLESARALARSQLVAEQAYAVSKKNNVELACQDVPHLFTHDPTPAQSFLRKIHCAAQEFNRDLVVYHLKQGLMEKAKTSKRKTQKGPSRSMEQNQFLSAAR